MPPIRIRFFFFALCIFFYFSSKAQNGWDDIKNNDNKLARVHFKTVLAKDSTDSHALEGMIYLSELEGDPLSLHKYVNTLINNHGEEAAYLLYSYDYDIHDLKSFIAKPNFSERAKTGARIAQATFGKKSNEQRETELHKIVPDYKWSVIGPFKVFRKRVYNPL